MILKSNHREQYLNHLISHNEKNIIKKIIIMKIIKMMNQIKITIIQKIKIYKKIKN